MQPGRLPIEDQVALFRAALDRNRTLTEVLARAATMDLPGWYLVAGREVFAGLPTPVQIRNQARVHLWYLAKFDVRCPPHSCTEAAIDSFEATNACLGVRLQPDGQWRIYASHGFADVFNLVARPDPVLAPRRVAYPTWQVT